MKASRLATLTILNVAYPLAAVGRDSVGGAEQIVSQLDEGLTAAGHNSLVIACQGSRVSGRLICTHAWNEALDSQVRHASVIEHARIIRKILEQEFVDVIHLHGIDFPGYQPVCDIPVLVTLHLPPHWYPQEIFGSNSRGVHYNCVSAAQQRVCPPCSNLLPFIENGVPVHQSSSRHCRRNFVLALGRICPEKGFHIALDAAKRADTPLILGGQVHAYSEHETYFRQQIAPRLNHARLFVGPVGSSRKQRFLSAARCLLVPSLVPETSSLVAMEAMACGTPVVAFPIGALAEIVEHGKTGFLVSDESEMAEAINACKSIDPETCRQTARERFNAARMFEEYLELYRLLSTGGCQGLSNHDQTHMRYKCVAQDNFRIPATL